MSKVLKSFNKGEDPVMSYLLEHSSRFVCCIIAWAFNNSDIFACFSRFHPVQEKLIKRTLELRSRGMLGAPEVVQLTQLLMRSINAKKAIDVGVFTGMSALSAALVLPDDGKVLACDVDESYTSIGINF